MLVNSTEWCRGHFLYKQSGSCCATCCHRCALSNQCCAYNSTVSQRDLYPADLETHGCGQCHFSDAGLRRREKLSSYSSNYHCLKCQYTPPTIDLSKQAVHYGVCEAHSNEEMTRKSASHKHQTRNVSDFYQAHNSDDNDSASGDQRADPAAPGQYSPECCPVDDEHVEHHDLFLQHILKTEIHRQERDRQRFDADSACLVEDAAAVCSGHVVLDGDRVAERDAEMRLLYGSMSERVLAAEMHVQQRFNALSDQHAPPLWPNIPIVMEFA